MMNTKLVILIGITVFLTGSYSFPLYDVDRSNVVNVNRKNFDQQINKPRAKNMISLVHFYKPDDLKSNGIKPEIEKLANDVDGMFKIGAVNCADFKDICDKHSVKDLPEFKIFPPLPAPVTPYEGKLDSRSLMVELGRYMTSKAIEINNNNIDNFVGEKKNLPKVFLFTDKKGVPLIYKSLSTAFDKKLVFGVVRSSDTGITSKYKVNSFPKIMVLPINARQGVFYEGENKYKPLFDFLNVYSETFFKVGEDKTKASDVTKEDKPWLQEKLPEFTKESANEVCFKVDGVLCVVLLNNDKPNDKISDVMSELQNYLSPKINRGIKYKFGWIDTKKQKQFVSVIGEQEGCGPLVMIINPGKRKRFYIMSGELNDENFKSVFDKLASGDLRFKLFKGNAFPELE